MQRETEIVFSEQGTTLLLQLKYADSKEIQNWNIIELLLIQKKFRP